MAPSPENWVVPQRQPQLIPQVANPSSLVDPNAQQRMGVLEWLTTPFSQHLTLQGGGFHRFAQFMDTEVRERAAIAGLFTLGAPLVAAGGAALAPVLPALPKLASMLGHANGGISNREHIARFSENNRAEAIIPLESDAANPAFESIADGIAERMVGEGLELHIHAGAIIGGQGAVNELARRLQPVLAQMVSRTGDINYGIQQ
jgi:hypothetical protein